MPLIQEVKILSYDKERNVCQAKNQFGEIFEIDPFVGCAIALNDDDYSSGAGFDIVGKKYAMSQYSVYESSVIPHAGGFVLIGE